MVLKVVIVGARVNEMSCAVVVQEKFPDADLKLFTDKFSPDTNSDGAARCWLPFSLGDTLTQDIYEYSKLTWTYLEKLWKPLLAGKMGVSLVPCIQTFDRTPPVPVVSDIVYGFQTIDSEELSSFNKPAWKSRFRFLTFITEASKLLPFYLTKLKSSNGIVVVRKLESPSYIATDFDVVINCSGLGAYHLENYQLPQAESEHRCYIIPNIVSGATHGKDRWDSSPHSNDTKSFLTAALQCTHL